MSKARSPHTDPEATAAYWINRTSRTLLRIHDERLRPLGFSMSQLHVLSTLDERGPMTQKGLAQNARVEQPTMAELLRRMQSAGLLRRRANPEDKRSYLFEISASAQKRLMTARAALLLGEQDIKADLTASEHALLVELLRRIVTHLELVRDRNEGRSP